MTVQSGRRDGVRGPITADAGFADTPALVWYGRTVTPEQAARGATRLKQVLGDLPGLIVRPLAFEVDADAASLFMQQPVGIDLGRLVQPGPVRVDHFLEISVQMANAVQAVHALGMMHGHISPAAFRIQPETRRLQLALHPDCLARPAVRQGDADGLELADLSYCAPEQSGRTANVVDLRADLYALGVVFHEMLAGRPPFQAIDRMELVHMHLAAAPPDLARMRPDLPPPLAAIVRKLLEKAPEDRYQTAYGLWADLHNCEAAYRVDREIPGFELGQKDALAAFRIPDRIYGREAQIATATAVFARGLSGKAEVVMLRGRSGAGKSALAEHLRELATASHQATFLSGKYDELQRLPYLALLDALREFVLTRIGRGAIELEKFLGELRERLGENLAVVADFLPELKPLVGELSAPPVQDPMERNQRFRIAIQGFFELLSSQSEPVVLFLDDLQWADTGSIDLLEDVLVSAPLENLIVLGAYRDNEVGLTHRVSRLIAALEESRVPTCLLDVAQLKVEDTSAMLADALHLPGDAVRGLAEAVHAKTQGNAFHLRRLVIALQDEGAIRFDVEAARWRWALDAVSRRLVDADVAALMTDRFERLSVGALRTLPHAAVLGTTFSVQSLGILMERPGKELEPVLTEAAREGFVVRGAADNSDQWSFSHDVVRESAYQLIDEGERKRLHYRIGAHLLRDIANPDIDDRLFLALDQFAAGIELLTEPSLGRHLTRCSLAAARRAKGVAAYDIAQRYLTAVSNLPPELAGIDWDTEPEVARALELEIMETEFLLSGFEVARPHFETLIARLPTDRDRAMVYQILVGLFTFRSQYPQALDYGIKGLKLLGVDLSKPYGPKIAKQLALTQIEVRRHDVFDFSTLPTMDNAASEQLIGMLMIVSTPAFLQSKDLFVLIALRMFRITLHDGLTSAGLASIQNYAIVIYLAFGSAERAHRIGTNLFPLLETRGISAQVRGRLYYTFSMVIAWHFRKYGELRELMREGVGNSWNAAELEYVGYFYYGILKYSWIMCVPLNELVDQLDDIERYQKRLHHEVLDSICAIYRRAVERLTGPASATMWQQSDSALQARMQGEASLGSFLTTQMLMTHIFGDWAVLDDLYQGMRAEEGFTTLGPEFVDYHLLSGLSLTRAPLSAVPLSRRRRRARIRRHLRTLRRLATKFPVNHGFQHILLSGEIARVRGRYEDALHLIERACRLAESDRIWSYAGIAAECGAAAAEALGDADARDRLILRAHAAYGHWGAVAKQRQLAASHRTLFADSAVALPSRSADGLDLSTIIKASQAILEISDLDTLLERLLHIAMENAGADSGALYLAQENALRLAAEARIVGSETEVQVHPDFLALETLDPMEYPVEIVTRVAATSATEITADALRDHRFDALKYVRNKGLKSVMCLPVASSGSLKAVLYLENSLARGVFTQGRGEIVATIVSLAAVSLSNAMLFARQQEALETQKRASGELVRINRLKDEFLANTSHELRTPLNGIIGLAESMIDGAAGPLSGAASQTLDLIAGSAKRLSGLVNDILDFSRLRDGEFELEVRPVDLHALVEVVLSLIAARDMAEPAKLVNAVPKENALVLADEDRLQQILLNLVDNASKFAAGGTVRVEAEAEAGTGQVAISVVDDGEGIPLEAHERIFRSFEQADASTQRLHGGVGLGLAITRSLVELHGSKISVRSVPGQGARFTFSLPATSDSKALRAGPTVARLRTPAPTPLLPVVQEPELFDAAGIVSLPLSGRGPWAQPKGGATQYRALVVDDDLVNLQVLQNFMQLESFGVVQARNGEESLRILSEGYEPDIVILDVMMPRMSGYEVCRTIRRTHPAARLPVILLTAKNQVEDLRAGFDAGATDYLTKPFSRDELSARMRTHIDLARISTAYERFVPNEFLKFLDRQSILDIALGDNVARTMTVMFTDIRGFTTLAEELTAPESFEFLSAYFSRMGPIVQNSGGVVSQYLGDGMMALFPGSAEDAVHSAVEIQRELRRFNLDRHASGRRPIGTGIGLHRGDLIVGVLGDEFRRTSNVVSDTVNLTARLEGLTAQFGIGIAASEQTIIGLPDPERFPHRRLGTVRVLGKQHPVDVFEIFAWESTKVQELKLATRELFEHGVRRLQAGDLTVATNTFSQVVQQNPDDVVGRRMAARCVELADGGLSATWDGIEVMTRK
ncbi:ATP-binding protein [Tropicimonas sp. IMCC34043]|uniref:ATP-binding protein n=1 Tax=Tropicimonas sp. IMCC34043 TaxID=2248760 RepID=UPI000E222DC5|nr:ATP-binding protein [Tropicimonas sp. IMCC34043]